MNKILRFFMLSLLAMVASLANAADPKTLPYEESFATSQGDFTINDVVITAPLTYVWRWNSSKYMKASAHVNDTNIPSESWLISPMIDLTGATTPTLTFDHTGKFFGTMTDEATLWIKTEDAAAWEEVKIPTYMSGNDWTFVTASIDLTAYAGKKIQVGFKYVSTAQHAGSWEVKNFKMADTGTPIHTELVIKGETPFVSTTTVTIIPANADDAVYYTLDGSDPADDSNPAARQYRGPFTLSETTTVKAFEEGANLKAEATFVKTEPIVSENIAAFKALPEGTESFLTLKDAIVLYSWTSNNNNNSTFVRDDTGALNVFQTQLGLEAGNIVNGTVCLTFKLFNGLPEGVNNAYTSADNLRISDGGRPVPVAATVDNAKDYLCDLIKLSNAVVEKITTSGRETYYVFNDDRTDSVQIYNGFHIDAVEPANLDPTKKYDITGIMEIYKTATRTTYELFPISIVESSVVGIEDIVTEEQKNAPVYNLAGQQVSKDYKGVVIVNGKKVINR